MRDAGERKRPFSKTNRSLIYDMQLWQISIHRSLTGLNVEDVPLAITKIVAEVFLQVVQNMAILSEHSKRSHTTKR